MFFFHPVPKTALLLSAARAPLVLLADATAIILVGNKSDMSSKQREVSMVEGMRFARRHGLDFVEVSQDPRPVQKSSGFRCCQR